MTENLEEIGKITHFFDKINVATIKLIKPLSAGDTIIIKGATTSFEQKVETSKLTGST